MPTPEQRLDTAILTIAALISDGMDITLHPLSFADAVTELELLRNELPVLERVCISVWPYGCTPYAPPPPDEGYIQDMGFHDEEVPDTVGADQEMTEDELELWLLENS